MPVALRKWPVRLVRGTDAGVHRRAPGRLLLRLEERNAGNPPESSAGGTVGSNGLNAARGPVRPRRDDDLIPAPGLGTQKGGIGQRDHPVEVSGLIGCCEAEADGQQRQFGDDDPFGHPAADAFEHLSASCTGHRAGR